MLSVCVCACLQRAGGQYPHLTTASARAGCSKVRLRLSERFFHLPLRSPRSVGDVGYRILRPCIRSLRFITPSPSEDMAHFHLSINRPSDLDLSTSKWGHGLLFSLLRSSNLDLVLARDRPTGGHTDKRLETTTVNA